MVSTPNVTKKEWGHEVNVVNNTLYAGKILTVNQGKHCSSFHYHDNKVETFYIIEGAIHLILYADDSLSPDKLLFDGVMIPGQTLTIECRQPHKFWGIEPINRFIEFSTMDYPEDSIRIPNT